MTYNITLSLVFRAYMWPAEWKSTIFAKNISYKKIHWSTNTSYSYTTVRVWYCSYYTSTRWSRVRVLITMISYKYKWYNWLVPCQRNWNQHLFKYVPALFCKTRSIYSNRAVGRSILLTVLLEYIDLCYSNKLICVPHSHSRFVSLYQVLN